MTAGNDFERDQEPPELFSALLTPHRSLNRTGFLVLMVFLSVVSFAAGLAFLLMGAWPVLGFMGLDKIEVPEATAGDIVFYGTLEGYLKAVDIQTGKELYRFKTPSGIIGNVNTFTHGGKQYVAVLSGVGGWAGIGMAAGLTKDTDGLGAVGAYKALANYTQLGGVLTVFGLPE